MIDPSEVKEAKGIVICLLDKGASRIKHIVTCCF